MKADTAYPDSWQMATLFHLWWFFRRCPLLKACCYNHDRGFETWWRGVVIGPLALGVIWRTKRREEHL